MDESRARQIALQSSQFVVVDEVLYFVDAKHDQRRRIVVPKKLQQRILKENHGNHMGAHFSGPKLFNALPVIGGGKACLLTLFTSHATAQSVQ